MRLPPTSLIYRCRSYSKPFNRLPFSVRNVGHYRLQPPFASNIKPLAVIRLFWGVNGKGIIELNGKKSWLGPRQIAIYKPGDIIKWSTMEQCWEYCYLSLDGSLADAIMTSFGLERGIHDAPRAPLAIFKKLIGTVPLSTRKSEINAALLAFRLLSMTTCSRNISADPAIEDIINHINQHWRNPELNIKTLAALFQIDRSVLSRRFKRSIGTSPHEYIGHRRLQHSLILLENSSRPVNDIALACGYTDPNYFSRLVRRITGQSCRAFRSHLEKTPDK